MLATRRKAVQSAARVRVGQIRHSTAQHGKHGDEVQHFAGSSTEHGHHHAGPENESFGAGFYTVLLGLPTIIGIYSISRPDANGDIKPFSKLIDKYSSHRETLARQNATHVAMLEQAAFDRNLFESDKGSKHRELKFPEVLNTGSPWNVVAGSGPRNMEEVVNFMEKQRSETEDAKLKVLTSGK